MRPLSFRAASSRRFPWRHPRVRHLPWVVTVERYVRAGAYSSRLIGGTQEVGEGRTSFWDDAAGKGVFEGDQKKCEPPPIDGRCK